MVRLRVKVKIRVKVMPGDRLELEGVRVRDSDFYIETKTEMPDL